MTETATRASSPPAPPMVAMSATGVRRAFGSVQAVANANLEVAPGRVTALIGPNGCGKTTLMLMLAGLLRPDAGEIRVGGFDPKHDGATVRQLVGWMPDVLGMWESMTSLDALTIAGRAYRIPAAQARATGRELLAAVHLTEFADRPTRVLSRGQKQRLSLARALVHDPQVLLLDEPASGLDPRSRVELRTLVRELAAQGKSVLISSHVLSELDEMVDDAVFMSRGVTLGADADAMVAEARTRWLITSLDDAAVTAALGASGREWGTPAAGTPGITVQVASEREAVDLLASLVRAGLPVVTFGPVGSALEQTYMAMNEERR